MNAVRSAIAAVVLAISVIIIALVGGAAGLGPASRPVAGGHQGGTDGCRACYDGNSLPAEYYSCETMATEYKPIGPEVWGPCMWDALYWTASGFCPERIEYYRTFFKVAPYILRCDECNRGFQALAASRPVDDYLTSPERLLEWVYLAHMDVRKHQTVHASSPYTFEDVLKRFLPRENGATAPRRRREPFAVRPVAPARVGGAAPNLVNLPAGGVPAPARAAPAQPPPPATQMAMMQASSARNRPITLPVPASRAVAAPTTGLAAPGIQKCCRGKVRLGGITSYPLAI